ncbi:replication endonuclease [Oceanimonas smirnovii]|uniref:replication endonuclease n=1 Tax=Oceanimonas smirnovii TaxID=264574 RepID=UPI003FD28B1A
MTFAFANHAADVAAFFAPTSNAHRVAGVDVDSSLYREHFQQANLKWVESYLSQVEDYAAGALFAHYQFRLKKGHKPSGVNTWLRHAVAKINEHAARFPLPLRMIANELNRASIARQWANSVAVIIQEHTQNFTRQVSARELLKAAMEPANRWGISPVLPVFKGEATDAQLDMAASALARLQDPEWWKRQITKAWRRYTEHVAILVGKVRRGVSAYVSRRALQDHQERKRASAAWLQTMYAINEELELEIPLAEAVKSSVSNPEIRRMELMVRMRGFEDLAEEQGLVGEFYTWTAPSKYHAWTVVDNRRKAKNGEKLENWVKTISNKKYQGYTPRETQAYLSAQWNKARAKLDRLGVRRFGFRVVEPHHDGTPHWHLLVFVHPSQRRLLRSVLRQYAIEHDREELGKKGYRARFDWKEIKSELGSATGYIAKYISKNIDGFKMDWDEESQEDAATSATAVGAWASLWNIRQFQQIGGPSVEVWRQLRRLRSATQNPILEPARQAADRARWAEFVTAMGGIDAQRKDHLIKLAHIIQPAASKYGEDVARLFGLCTADITVSVNGVTTGVMVGVSEIQTRHQGWTLSRTGLGSSSGGSRAPWSSDNNCTEDQKPAGNDPLSHELAMLGLDEKDKKRLLTGTVIEIDGLFISIRNGCLNTSRQRPGLWRPEDPVAIAEANEFAELEHERTRELAAQYRLQVAQLLDDGGSIKTWMAGIPEQHLPLALEQADALLDKIEREARRTQRAEPMCHEDDFEDWTNELCQCQPR